MGARQPGRHRGPADHVSMAGGRRSPWLQSVKSQQQRQSPLDVDRGFQERAVLMNRTKMTARAASNLPSALRRLARARDGVSATEFALILPIMLTLYIGSVELGDGIAINFKTTLAARTVADVASQCGVCTVTNTGPNGTIDATEMQSILNSSTKVLAPYSTSNVVITLSELKVSPNQ